MIKFVQHIPSFIQTDKFPEPFFFNTTEELVGHLQEIVKPNERFYRYSITGDYVMEEKDEGKVWWVLGRVSDPAGICLPQWEAK